MLRRVRRLAARLSSSSNSSSRGVETLSFSRQVRTMLHSFELQQAGGSRLTVLRTARVRPPILRRGGLSCRPSPQLV